VTVRREQPPFPAIVSPAMLMAPDAMRGHVDPWVADQVIRANGIIRRDLDQPGAEADLRSILDRLLRHDDDSVSGCLRRWYAKRRLLSGIKRCRAERMYVALAAVSMGVDPIWKQAAFCNLVVIALPHPFPVHGMPLFPEVAPAQ
jgi:hypothetical protein